MDRPPENPRLGALYSRQYLERGRPLPDDKRARYRLGYFVETYFAEFHKGFLEAVQLHLGVEVPGGYDHSYLVRRFFDKATIDDVLSAVTLVSTVATDVEVRKLWVKFVKEVFADQNLAYTVDAKGGVHPLIDAEFQRNIASAIAGLGIPRYAAARSAFEAAQRKLEHTPPDTKGAIRDIFEAAETLTKLIDASGKSLDSGFVRSELERGPHSFRQDAGYL